MGFLGGVRRRQPWLEADRVRILAERFAPGARVVDVARRNGVAVRRVFAWRRQAREASQSRPTFVAVEVADKAADGIVLTSAAAAQPQPQSKACDRVAGQWALPQDGPRMRCGLIEIELSGGHRVRVDKDVDAKALGRNSKWRVLG